MVVMATHSPSAAPALLTAQNPAGVDELLGVPRPSRLRKVLAVLLAVSALGGVGAGTKKLLDQRASQRGPQYQTAAVTKGDLRVTITATGTLQAITTVEVGSEVSGRAIKVDVDANDRVKKGQVVAVIDPEPLQAAVDQAQAQLVASDAAIRQAQATLVEAKSTADRTQKTAAEGLASQKDVEGALASLARAQASVASANANSALNRALLVQAKSKLDKAIIVSPIDGLVLSRSIEPGQTVTAGFTTPVLFKVAEDLTKMRLDVDVDEADIGRAREGQEASFTVEAYPSQTFPSKVQRLLNDPKTSSNVVSYQGRLSVDNGAGLLRPGMTATAVIVTETKHDVLLIPNAALRYAPSKPMQGPPGPPGFGGPGPKEQVEGPSPLCDKAPPGISNAAAKSACANVKSVYVAEGGQVKKVSIKVGSTDGTSTEVVAGDLAPGARVVTDATAKE